MAAVSAAGWRGRASGQGSGVGGLINSGAPDRVWFGCFCAFLPGLKRGELGQAGAGRRATCSAAVTGLAGDGIGADFGHGCDGMGWVDRLTAPGLIQASQLYKFVIVVAGKCHELANPVQVAGHAGLIAAVFAGVGQAPGAYCHSCGAGFHGERDEHGWHGGGETVPPDCWGRLGPVLTPMPTGGRDLSPALIA